MMKVLVATNNPSKVARYRLLMSEEDVLFVTPSEEGIEAIEVEEGSDIEENAKIKAFAYVGKTTLPIIANDTAFVIEDETHDPAQVRRVALAGMDESTMTREEIVRAYLAFYQDIVKRRGGPVPAYWEDCFALVHPDGSVNVTRSRRPVFLTGEVKGVVDDYFPLRSIYVVEATGKYVFEQTKEEEGIELAPIYEALMEVLGRKKT